MKLFENWPRFLVPRLLPIILAAMTVVLFYGWVNIKSYEPKYLFLKDDVYGDYGYISYSINYKFKPNQLSIINLGGSTMREALNSRHELARKIFQATGKHYQVWNFSSSSQTPTESLAIFDSLRLKPGSILVINIDAFRLSQSLNSAENEYSLRRIPFLNYSSVKKIITSAGGHVTWSPEVIKNRSWLKGVYEMRSKNFHKMCILSTLTHHHACFKIPTRAMWGKGLQTIYLPHTYQTTMNSNEKRQFAYTSINYGLPAYFNSHEFSTSVLQDLINQARQKGIYVIILDLPRGPIGKKIQKKISNTYFNDVKKLINAGATYVSFINNANFRTQDFHDDYHFISSGRKKFEPMYVNMIKQAIQKEHQHVKRQES